MGGIGPDQAVHQAQREAADAALGKVGLKQPVKGLGIEHEQERCAARTRRCR